MTHIIEQRLFHVQQDVCIPSKQRIGYVFAISEEEKMLFIKSFDGGMDGWFHFHEVEHMTLENSARLLDIDLSNNADEERQRRHDELMKRLTDAARAWASKP
jgi:hypothetical protein